MSYSGFIAERGAVRGRQGRRPEGRLLARAQSKADEYPDAVFVRRPDQDTGEELRVRYAPGLVRLPALRPRPPDLSLVLHPRVADQGHRAAGSPAPPGPGRTGDRGARAARLEDLRTGPGLRRVPQRGHQPGRRGVPAPAPERAGRRSTRSSTPSSSRRSRRTSPCTTRTASTSTRRPWSWRRSPCGSTPCTPAWRPLVRPPPAARQLADRRPARGVRGGAAEEGRLAGHDPGAVPADGAQRGRALPEGAVHHFLLPAKEWGAVAAEKEAKALAPEDAKALGAWRKAIAKSPTAKQTARLQGLARRTEYLWDLVASGWRSPSGRSRGGSMCGTRRRLAALAEGGRAAREGTGRPEAVDTPYWRLKKLMDAWCALWFWPVQEGGLLDGPRRGYARADGTCAERGEAGPGRRRTQP